jgi:hypothetical protein
MAINKTVSMLEDRTDYMASGSTKRQDTLRFEKLTLLVLALCLLGLLGVQLFRFF